MRPSTKPNTIISRFGKLTSFCAYFQHNPLFTTRKFENEILTASDMDNNGGGSGAGISSVGNQIALLADDPIVSVRCF